MNPLQQMLLSIVDAVLPVLIDFFKKHILPHGKFQSLPPAELRSAAHAWVLEAFNDLVSGLVAKGVIPLYLQPFLPPLEAVIADLISKALDAAGL